MMEYREDDYLNIAGIQHYTFCRRQWALIHLEQQWNENIFTIEGNILHEKAHDITRNEKRGSIIISRSLPVYSSTLGVNGFCDIVEFYKSEQGIMINGYSDLYKPIPVEYKRGKPKVMSADRLQLCTQAICLEEMLFCKIEEAYLFYGEIKHREKIILDDKLREETCKTWREMHIAYEKRQTPKVYKNKQCKSCSLYDLCLPELVENLGAEEYISKILKENRE